MKRDDSSKPFLSTDWAVREVDQLFTRIRAYTRFVLYSKWFLGVFALVLMGSLIAYPMLTKNHSGIRVSFTDPKAAKGPASAASPVMNNPEFHSTGDAAQQFVGSGIRATQVTPSLVVIDQVQGRMTKPDGSWLNVTANRADYHQDTKIVILTGQVTTTNDQGYVFVTEAATVNTQTSEIHGEMPVVGTGPTGKLIASTFRIEDNGQHIVFTNGGGAQVKLRIDRKKQ